ncbi:MAG: hypothetical protein JWM59_1943 [Verrucomicrobiales bacterium]|nr:hypothetical protein [Verrucomicrobiales bacterium]
MKLLLAITAVMEAVTGLGLLLSPSLIVRLLLGTPPDGLAAGTVGRIAGAALLALGLACWMARAGSRALVLAMLFYNAAAGAILAHAALGAGLSGPGLWLAIGLHTALAAWCVAVLRSISVHRAATGA